jgi:predicted amidohydrolase YtcJ
MENKSINYQKADEIFINGRFYTVDPKNPWADAVAVKDGKFIAVGNNEAINSYIDKNTKVNDLNGHMAMPGIHDAHTHLLEAAYRPLGYQCNLDDPKTLEELEEQLTTYWKDNSHREWLVAGIYNPLILTENILTIEYLDALFPDTPVIIYDFSAVHNCQVNSKALELAGIDRNTPNPPGGKIVKDSVTGEPTGMLVEAATAFTVLQVPPYSDEEISNCLRFTTNTSAQFGITSVQEASTTRSVLEAAKWLEDNGELPIHIFSHLLYNFPAIGGWETNTLDELINDRESYRGQYLHPDGVKIFLDGTSLPPQFTHVPLDPDSDEPITYNLMVPHKTLADRLALWSKLGLKVKTHCTGAGSVRIALDNYERTLESKKDPTLMHDIAHARFISNIDFNRFSELGVVAEMSPAIWHDPVYKEVLKNAFAFNTLHEAGAMVTIGSDWILTKNPNLFPGLGGVLMHGNESVSLENAVKMMTINGAISVGKENDWGSIEKGKDATFIILDRNLFEVTPEEIQGTNVIETIVNGKTVYKNKTYTNTSNNR